MNPRKSPATSHNESTSSSEISAQSIPTRTLTWKQEETSVGPSFHIGNFQVQFVDFLLFHYYEQRKTEKERDEQWC